MAPASIATLALAATAACVSAHIPLSRMAAGCAPTDNPNDCAGLMALYDSTNGRLWNPAPHGWLNGSSVCTWEGVSCIMGTNRVDSIVLTNRTLNGKLPNELFEMDKLVQIYLDQNQLSGPLPASVSSAPNLQYLYLNNNYLTGSLPAQLADLLKLHELHLSFNALSGGLDVIGNMPSLIDIYLDHNQFTGSLPAGIGNIGVLRDLIINDNRLSGPIPEGVCGSMPPRRDCNMARNTFACPIPACVPSNCVASCA